MNWLGLSLRSLVGIVIGVGIGLLLFAYALPQVWLVGAAAGVACALAAQDRSALRGISVATAATWAAAVVDARRLGISTFRISTTLTGPRWAAYLGCVGLAFALGGWSLRRRTRTAGT